MKKRKRMKLPNGFGSIIFLAECNKDPSIYLPSQITFSEIYKLEIAERKTKITATAAKNYDVSFGYCKALHTRPLASIKVIELQTIIKNLSAAGIGHATQKKVRQLYHNIYTYAVKYQIIPPTASTNHMNVAIHAQHG